VPSEESGQTPDNELARIKLRRVDPAPFSPRAFDALQDQIDGYIAELINESVREARRQHVDIVSETHVARASDYLASNSGRRLFRHLGTIGGVLLGASVSNLLAMATSTNFTYTSVALTTAFGIIGGFVIALHMARD
jgi:hypothetical protein